MVSLSLSRNLSIGLIKVSARHGKNGFISQELNGGEVMELTTYYVVSDFPGNSRTKGNLVSR